MYRFAHEFFDMSADARPISGWNAGLVEVAGAVRASIVGPVTSSDLSDWVRIIDRAKHRVGRPVWRLDDPRLFHFTHVSFCLEQLDLPRHETERVIARSYTHRGFRSRLSARLRNHAAILLRIERLLASGRDLRVDHLLQWYAGISAGLCSAMPAGPKIERLQQVLRRVNSPHMRIGSAVTEIASLHYEALTDALVPSFHGIIARLLLHYQLGRCGLLPPAFRPEDVGRFRSGAETQRCIMQRVADAYEKLS
jgi:hypothetical protein